MTFRAESIHQRVAARDVACPTQSEEGCCFPGRSGPDGSAPSGRSRSRSRARRLLRRRLRQRREPAGPVDADDPVDSTETTVRHRQGLADAFTAENPDITFELEIRPQGTEGDNVVKTRLQTGDMTDLF